MQVEIDMPSAKRILVTGATGKVGRTFIGRLLSDPRFDAWTIRALCHNRPLPTRATGWRSSAGPSRTDRPSSGRSTA